MADDGFDTNFTWFEWSFVSPGDLNADDLQVPERERAPWAVDGGGEEDRTWMT